MQVPRVGFGMRREISRLFVILALYFVLMNIRSRRTADEVRLGAQPRYLGPLPANRILPAVYKYRDAWVAFTLLENVARAVFRLL